MSNNSQDTSPADAFAGFWQDFMDRMGGDNAVATAMPSPAFTNEAVKQMQRVFFDAMAKYCDDFMRSEQFLMMMKQTMDRSLAFKQQMDQFLGQVQKGVQTPARADIDDLAGTLRHIERRVLDRIEALEKKVSTREGGVAPRTRQGAHQPRARAKKPRPAPARKTKRGK